MRLVLLIVMGLSGLSLVVRSYRTAARPRGAVPGERLSGCGLLLLALSAILARLLGDIASIAVGLPGLLGLVSGVALMLTAPPVEAPPRGR